MPGKHSYSLSLPCATQIVKMLTCFGGCKETNFNPTTLGPLNEINYFPRVQKLPYFMKMEASQSDIMFSCNNIIWILKTEILCWQFYKKFYYTLGLCNNGDHVLFVCFFFNKSSSETTFLDPSPHKLPSNLHGWSHHTQAQHWHTSWRSRSSSGLNIKWT